MDDGILIINKPSGMTSHDVVNVVRRTTGERRVGHAGTLDPLARGILIILVGRDATKRQAEFLRMPKVYEAEITFGSVSKTYDAEGPIENTATFDALQCLSRKDVATAFQRFVGDVAQRVPAFAAVKVAGQPLYKKARRGTISEDALPVRTVRIDTITLLRFIPFTPPFPPTARVEVRCGSGTYIRSLAHDVGQALSVGAYLSDLVRTAVGPYTLEQAKNLEEIS